MAQPRCLVCGARHEVCGVSFSQPIDERGPVVAEGDTTERPEMGLFKNTNRAGTEYVTKMSVKEAEALGLERAGDVREPERKPGPDDPEEAYAGVAPIGGRMHPEEAANVAAVEAERDEAATKEAAAEKRRETANKARQATDKK